MLPRNQSTTSRLRLRLLTRLQTNLRPTQALHRMQAWLRSSHVQRRRNSPQRRQRPFFQTQLLPCLRLSPMLGLGPFQPRCHCRLPTSAPACLRHPVGPRHGHRQRPTCRHQPLGSELPDPLSIWPARGLSGLGKWWLRLRLRTNPSRRTFSRSPTTPTALSIAAAQTSPVLDIDEATDSPVHAPRVGLTDLAHSSRWWPMRLWDQCPRP